MLVDYSMVVSGSRCSTGQLFEGVALCIQLLHHWHSFAILCSTYAPREGGRAFTVMCTLCKTCIISLRRCVFRGREGVVKNVIILRAY